MKPRIHMANLPTPVEFLPQISHSLNGPKVWTKRDDLTGGLGFSGNKTRKLEFVVAEAKAAEAQTLITVGSIQSNHCRQTAAFATRFGFNCILVLFGEEPDQSDGNLLLDRLFGAQVVWTTRDKYHETMDRVMGDAVAAGKKPFLIPLGASTPTGTLGYAAAMHEFMEQNVDVDVIVSASSSCGTQAGMVLGARIYGFSGKILGISIDHKADEMKKRIAFLASEASESFGKRIDFSADEILVNDDFIGPGYAVMTDLEKNAIHLFARSEGLLLDPVYTGRAAGGMIDLIRRGELTRAQKVLFWHTGGAAALFAQPYQKQILP